MAEPEIMTATDASRGFSELLHRVCYGGESFVIKKGNRLMARITPVEVAVETHHDKVETAPVAPSRREEEKRLLAELPPEEAEYFAALMDEFCKTPA